MTGAALVALLGGLLRCPASGGAEYGLLYVFQGGNDGVIPMAGLLADADGNLYGTTFNGGGSRSEGTVFEITPPAKAGGTWTETVLHRFLDLAGGQYPFAGLVSDKSGNFYGTTWLGGNGPCSDETCGTVFEISPPHASQGAWTYAVLHDFTGLDGGASQATMVMDRAGNLYGTTSVGGSGACFGGCGVVFELSRAGSEWSERVLYDFPGIGHGDDVYGGTGGPVTLDADGNLFGTTIATRAGGGAVFELVRPHGAGVWRYKDAYVFRSAQEGSRPLGGVTFDAAGALYGTTEFGGDVNGCFGNSCGTIFRLTRGGDGRWKHAVLHTFAGTGDGSLPRDALTVDSGGTTLYGTTPNGGTGAGCTGLGCGVLFRLTFGGGRWTETVLHTYRGNGDGYVPYGGTIRGPRGVLYGATEFGGLESCNPPLGCGTIYTASP